MHSAGQALEIQAKRKLLEFCFWPLVDMAISSLGTRNGYSIYFNYLCLSHPKKDSQYSHPFSFDLAHGLARQRPDVSV